jgi:hypothetical protein
MTRKQDSVRKARWKEELKQILSEDRDLLKEIVQETLRKCWKQRWMRRCKPAKVSGRMADLGIALATITGR